jgi:hypothetical protein
MRILIVVAALLAVTVQAQMHSGSSTWPRVYVERSLQWKGGTSAPPGSLDTSATLLYLFEDHRYIAVGVTLQKGKVHYKTPAIIENEGYLVRAGSWRQGGDTLRLHSAFAHIEARITPYPTPVDERFIPTGKNWLVEGGPLKVAEDQPSGGRMPLPSGGTAFVPVGAITGVKNMQQDATLASCHYFKSHPQDSDESWNAVCKEATTE